MLHQCQSFLREEDGEYRKGKDDGAEGSQVAALVDSLVLLYNQMEFGIRPPNL